MKRVLRAVVPVVIVLLGVGAAVGLFKLKPKAAKASRPAAAISVDVQTVGAAPEVARVQVTGVVEPSRQVVVSPEVSGRLVWVAPDLVAGGRVRAGDALMRVDSRDYELSIEQQESAVQQARLQLELEQNQGQIAKREWELLGNKNVKASPIALREPQLRTAEVQVKSAESGLRRARLALERTTVRAPFNALVLQEAVEVGQVVAPGAQAATLIGTDRFWITAQVPVEQLAYLTIPGGEAREGSAVTVVQDLGGSVVVKKGRVLRLKGGLDPQTRTAQLVIGVDDPLDPTPGAEGAAPLPLLTGAFVEVEIEGLPIPGVWQVPRSAVSDGNRLWVVDAEDRLLSREVRIAWRTRDALFIDQGLQDGERVVVSPLSLPIEGQKVQVATDRARAESAAAAGQ